MSSRSATATTAGVFYLVTEVSAILGLLLYQPVLTDPGYVSGGGADSRVLLGALCEIVLVIAIVGSAVTLYPVVRRENESIALGLVAGRLLEAAVITVGMVSVLAVVTLRDEGASNGTDETALIAVNQGLIAVHDWTFLVGPSFLLGLNSLMLAYLVHRMQLVPRWIATLGLIGGPLVFVSAVAVLFGLYSPTSHAVSAIPVFAWEVSFAIYLIVKGFRPSEALPVSETATTQPPPALSHA